MKSFFTFLLLSCFLFTNAQNLELSSYEMNLDNLDDYINYGDLTLSNFSSDEIEIAIRLESECYVDGDNTAIQICIGASCFLSVSETTTWGETGSAVLTLGANEATDQIKFTPLPVGTHGSSWNLVLFDRNNPDRSVTLVVNIAECTDLVNTIDYVHEVGEAFPNPASDFIQIPYQHDAADAQLLVYNTVGVRMESIVLDQYNNQVELNVADYTNGIYFYHIMDSDGGLSPILSFVK